jgi:hypothetical protein
MQDAEALMSPALRKPTDDEKREIFDVLKSTAAHLPAEYELRIHELRYKEAFVFVREDILRLAELISKRKPGFGRTSLQVGLLEQPSSPGTAWFQEFSVREKR